jgi:hypothetical protein
MYLLSPSVIISTKEANSKTWEYLSLYIHFNSVASFHEILDIPIGFSPSVFRTELLSISVTCVLHTSPISYSLT